MKNKRFLSFGLITIFFTQFVLAQDKSNYKFGKITADEVNITAPKFDSGANAVILADIGTVKFEGNTNSFFTLIYTRFVRVKILNKNGMDIGQKEISLYHNSVGESEKLYSIKGSTFNLENGQLIETKLDEKSIYTEKYSKNIDDKKFSMPALKAGSIYDLEYTIKSPFAFTLPPWSFQGDYPCLWSEFQVTIPPPLHYVMSIQGDRQFFIDTAQEVFRTYSVRQSNGSNSDDSYSISGTSTYKRWVKKDVPALHEESFTTTIKNYYSRVAFQLNYVQWTKDSQKHTQLATWAESSKVLMEDEEFGLGLNHENNWMSDELKSITQGAGKEEEKTARIYYYIRDNFKCTKSYGLYAHSSLKEIFKLKEGNVAEINLLLTAMLRKAGIRADPMILSTRDNGIANISYPLMNEYNYVICVSYPDGKVVPLDASQPYIGFGQIPINCYNGWGEVINAETPVSMEFSSDSITESSTTSVVIINDEKGKVVGSFQKQFGKNESYKVREEIIHSSEKDYLKKIQKENDALLQIENMGIDSLKKFDFPITVHYDMELKNLSSAGILYFNPMLDEVYNTNPFKSTERLYPVEIPYKIDETYTLNMEIPEGYQVDEIPKSARVAYNENEGMFEYLIQVSGRSIQMRVRLKLNKAFFPTDEYGTLRDFFAFVVKKENEQVVFKKIK